MGQDVDRPCLMFVVGMQPTKIGGVEKFLRALVVRLDSLGWNSVLCFDGSIFPAYREYFNLPFTSLEVLTNQGNLGFGAAGPLRKLLRTYRPQVFVYAFHGAMRCFPRLARMAGCKRIFFNDHSSRAPGLVAKPLSLPKRLVGRILTAPLTSIISVADFTRRTGTTFGTTSAPNIVVTNGIEILPAEPERGADIRRRYGIAPHAIVLVQVCWMVEVKGVKVMLHAARILLAAHPRLRFLLVGGGEKLEEYKALAHTMGLGEAVVFTDIVSDPVGAGILDASDVYCQPSLWQEACPLAVLEAMSKRLPVVASNTGGLPELIADGETGVLVPAGDGDTLAAALDEFIRDPERRRRMGEAGFQAVLRKHRMEDMVSRYIELFLK